MVSFYQKNRIEALQKYFTKKVFIKRKNSSVIFAAPRIEFRAEKNVGDLKLVTICGCWSLIFDVGEIF